MAGQRTVTESRSLGDLCSKINITDLSGLTDRRIDRRIVLDLQEMDRDKRLWTAISAITCAPLAVAQLREQLGSRQIMSDILLDKKN